MVPPRPDITSREQITALVDAFYAGIRADRALGPIFDDVAHVNWDEHLPRMYDFWETVLLGAASFKGNPLAIHRALARITPLPAELFARWELLFHATIDRLFLGPVADNAKRSATRIAFTMQVHIGHDRLMGVAL
ncbi:MAG: group III truncated hemoglobin [Vicinamibacterales bacterium]